MAAPRSFADGDGDDMNASLWGELQSFIDLSMIYAKLPLAPFFRLRQVCKEWNRLASDSQFLEQNFKPPISSNPYFVVTRPSGRHFLLTSEGSSWSSTSVPPARCEVSGLLFEDSDRNRVFDVHTRVFHTLPPLPAVEQLLEEEQDYYEYSSILMTVDTALIPYGFRVVSADYSIGTRIYDSNSGTWTHEPSSYKSLDAPAFGTSCVHFNKSLYIRAGDESYGLEVYVEIYDLEGDVWDYKELESARPAWEYGEIGVWQDRFFVLAVDTEFPHDVMLEEISDDFKACTSFDRMPGDLREWMMVSGDHEILNKFCGEHMLLYNRRGVKEERAVLYNLDQKTWDKIELPASPRKDHRLKI